MGRLTAMVKLMADGTYIISMVMLEEFSRAWRGMAFVGHVRFVCSLTSWIMLTWVLWKFLSEIAKLTDENKKWGAWMSVAIITLCWGDCVLLGIFSQLVQRIGFVNRWVIAYHDFGKAIKSSIKYIFYVLQYLGASILFYSESNLGRYVLCSDSVHINILLWTGCSFLLMSFSKLEEIDGVGLFFGFAFAYILDPHNQYSEFSKFGVAALRCSTHIIIPLFHFLWETPTVIKHLELVSRYRPAVLLDMDSGVRLTTKLSIAVEILRERNKEVWEGNKKVEKLKIELESTIREKEEEVRRLNRRLGLDWMNRRIAEKDTEVNELKKKMDSMETNHHLYVQTLEYEVQEKEAAVQNMLNSLEKQSQDFKEQINKTYGAIQLRTTSEALALLLENGADPKSKDNTTPILSAVAAGSHNCVILVMKAGADVTGGATPLLIAADEGSTKIDPNAPDQAASCAQGVAYQPGLRLGNLHPAVKRAEEEPEVDPQELSEIKVASVRGLPDEGFLKQLFEPFGKVEKIVVSEINSFPDGSVHFDESSATSRAQRVAPQPDFRHGNLHPAVKWAEEEPEVDPQELSEINVAFVRSLPSDTDESFLKQLFEQYGKVEKVVVFKGSFPVGFVHFCERSDLEQSIKELHDEQTQGPHGGSFHTLQVKVARPFDKTKKRARDTVESNLPVQGQFKHLKEQPTPNVLPITSHSSLVQKHGIESTDPYEDAMVALPLAVKERLLQILRLDIDVNTLRSLKELPESNAISVLDQFKLSGSSSQNKGVCLSELISAAQRGMAKDTEPSSYSPGVSPGACSSSCA